MDYAVSIGEDTVEKCVNALEGVDFAEVRLDLVKGLDVQGVERIFAMQKKLIAACRPSQGLSEEVRKGLLLAAVDRGAAYVDVEVDSPDWLKQEVVTAARKKQCKVIVSFHDFEKTPKREELLHVVEWCFECGADIAKIACKANDKRDAARLMGLLDCDKALVVVGMGENGRVTRVAGPLLGSVFSYASIERGRETADGQIDIDTIKRIKRETEQA